MLVFLFTSLRCAERLKICNLLQTGIHYTNLGLFGEEIEHSLRGQTDNMSIIWESKIDLFPFKMINLEIAEIGLWVMWNLCLN